MPPQSKYNDYGLAEKIAAFLENNNCFKDCAVVSLPVPPGVVEDLSRGIMDMVSRDVPAGICAAHKRPMKICPECLATWLERHPPKKKP